MKPIIQVENLSKRFSLGNPQKRFSTLAETIFDRFRSPLSSFRNRAKGGENSFWALKDVNFEVMPGEVIGIIGRNGAGKSTLLKILSRITKPTAGKVKLYGRVESLLEVGTGFHPELTGRENIFLNGAILGMGRAEISKKFDEIVAFAEVEQFLDMPVKHYSSGMYVRLAFAVAAHLEPEILVIDEVLAVGDAEFQKKCLGKMDEVSKNGRTVIFVSHQMGSIAQLCQKAIMLEKGSIIMFDKASPVIEHYIGQSKSKTTTYAAESSSVEREMFIENATILNGQSVERGSFANDEGICIKVKCLARKMIRGVELRLAIRDLRGVLLFVSDVGLDSLVEGNRGFEVDFMIPPNVLRPNNYSVIISLFVPHQDIIELLEDVVFFSIFDNGTKYAQSEGIDYGVMFSPCKTAIKQIT